MGPRTWNWEVWTCSQALEHLCELITKSEEGCGQDAHSWGCAKGPLMTGQEMQPADRHVKPFLQTLFTEQRDSLPSWGREAFSSVPYSSCSQGAFRGWGSGQGLPPLWFPWPSFQAAGRYWAAADRL